MERLTVDQIVQSAWENFPVEDLVQLGASLFPTWQFLSEGRPVPPAQVASALDKPLDDVRSELRAAEEAGYAEFDDQGNIVHFMGMLLRPSPFRVRMDDQQLFAA
jgi:hypothetical protein